MRNAARELRLSLARSLEKLPREQFVRACSAGAYLFPGLHPDGYDDADSGWPYGIRRFAAGAWRRADAGELADEELHPGGAAWSGLYDRMLVHLPEETEHRVEFAAADGG